MPLGLQLKTRSMLPIMAPLTNDFRGIIYDCNMFIVQAKDLSFWDLLWKAFTFKIIFTSFQASILVNKFEK
jgi:hypothetical protein